MSTVRNRLSSLRSAANGFFGVEAAAGPTAPSGVTPGTYGSSANSAALTVDADGLVTTAAENALSASYTEVSHGAAFGGAALTWVGFPVNPIFDESGNTTTLTFTNSGTYFVQIGCYTGGGGQNTFGVNLNGSPLNRWRGGNTSSHVSCTVVTVSAGDVLTVIAGTVFNTRVIKLD